MVSIEPIKNQYLTALKERQQIIDKLNEIISGLNALNFDDLTTIQSELVAIRESLQTQNTAITEINNSIGQIETELTSFDNRLITLNTNIENTESNLTSFENDTALNLQAKVNKNGDTMTGNLTIPTTTTGNRDNFAVNGTRLQNDLDNYNPMVRNSGNQTIYGNKDFRGLTLLSINKVIDTGSNGYKILYRIKSTSTSSLLFIGGRTIAIAQISKSGGYKKVIATSGRPYDVPWLWVCVKNNEYYLVSRGLYSATMNIIPINTFIYGTHYNFLEENEIINTVTVEPVIGENWDEVIEVGNYD